METESKIKAGDVHDLLSKIRSSQDPNYTLYHHLQKLYQVKLEMKDDDKFLDLFEDISLRLKKEGKYILEDKINKNVFTYLTEYCKNISNKKSLVTPLMKPDTQEQPEPFGPVGNVPEYYNMFQLLEW